MDRRHPTTEDGWQERPGLAKLIRVGAFVAPIVVSIAIGWLLTSRLPDPVSTGWGILRWALVAVASLLTLVAAERVARRFIPLATLFKLSLAFPDEVPSRLGVALRVGTTAQLAKRIDEKRTGPQDEPPGDAARRLLELVGLLSRHDRLTRGHSERVRGYAHMVGLEMGVSGRDLDRLRWAALLHDIGKIDVPSEILNKPGRLTDEEFDVIKQHPLAGKAYVEPLEDWLGEAARAVWEHHERFDGGGYPHGLSGTDISMAGRVVCVIDAYDVMTSARSYKKPMSGAEARAELSKHAGAQFDPDVVRAFLNLSLPVGGHSRVSRWASQATLLPQSIVTQLGAATAPIVAAAVVGATVASAGLIAQAAGASDTVVIGGATTTTVPGEVPDRSIGNRESDRAPRATASSTTISDLTSEPETTISDERSGAPTDGSPAPETTSPESTSTGTTTTTLVANTTTTTSVVANTTTTVAPTTSGPATTVSVTFPDVTVPDVTVPDVTDPNTTLPPETVPDVTLPDVTVPQVTVTVPDVTVPQVTVTVPDVTVPQVTVTVPDVTVPQVTVTVPDVTVPQVTVPDVTVPQGTLPVTLPVVTLPDLGF